MTDTPKTPNTPGSRAMEVAKVQDRELAQFKMPLPSSGDGRKHKPKILTEERYIEEMSKIIQRDFFPDLERLRAQNDYLDAESRRDFLQMAEIRARYSLGRASGTGNRRNSRNNAMSPATFETPLSTANAGSTPLPNTPHSTASSQKSSASKNSAEGGCQDAIGRKMSLDSFLHNYTSEDNQSFQEIIETAEMKLRQKYAVLYNHEQLSTEQLQRALLLPSLEQQFDTPDPLRKIETWKYTNKNSVMYVPDGVEMSEQENVKHQERKPTIRHDATRLPTTCDTETQASHPDANANRNATGEEASTSTPRIRGFDLLRSPSPRPGKAFSPIMTWGEIDGTPFRLDGGDTPLRNMPGPSFHINENSRRENIAIALAEKVSEKMRNQKQQALNTARRNIGSPFVRSSIERLASMSPAARRLATGKLGLRNHTPLLTPSPATRKRKAPSVVRTMPPMTNSKHIPGKGTPSNAPTPIDTGSTLTDDLLKIPAKRRSAAADFF
ncbi:splicing factor ESS-2 homolog [Drosophila hydei]|uniref:Splicing factor ESS-2 homolog n=1 Tax=Drosophila hydei TaxID=7224 RepID=A0A6J1M537_DROHY|nr:splicing factor ESS-2 homolog [Drosophila hydei]